MEKIKLLVEIGPLLDSNRTGVGFYMEGLIGALAELETITIYGFYFDFLNRRNFTLPEIPNLTYKKISYVPEKLIVLLKRFGLQPVLGPVISRNVAAYMFSNYVSLPTVRHRPSILVVYDLGYLDVPQYAQEVTLKYLKKSASRSIQSAAIVITISEFTKGRIEHFFPQMKGKIIITPIPPAAAAAGKTILTPRLRDAGVIPGKFLLYLGTIEPRKNLEALLSAYALLSPDVRARYSLVMAGGKGWKNEAILKQVESLQRSGASIIQTGYVSDEEKAALYSNAALFVFPSHYEGFGMPILEAMQYGLPTAISDIPVFREVAGEAALYFDKDNPIDISEKILSILDNEDMAAALRAKAQENLARFSWRSNAEVVQAGIRGLLAE